MFGNKHSVRHNRYAKSQLKEKIRQYREQMLSQQDIRTALHIRNDTFYKLLNEIEEEDSIALGFDKPKHLMSTLTVYQRQLAYCVAVNRKICESEISSDKDKQESTRIIADCALTWAKVQMEGPRAVKEIYGPIAEFTRVEGNPVPVPGGQQKVEKYTVVEQLPDGTGLAIPVPEEEEEGEEEQEEEDSE